MGASNKYSGKNKYEVYFSVFKISGIFSGLKINLVLHSNLPRKTPLTAEAKVPQLN